MPIPRTLLLAAALALAAPAAASAAPSLSFDESASQAAVAIWSFPHPDGDGVTGVVLAGRQGARASSGGGARVQNGLEPTMFELSCDEQVDEIVLTELEVRDPLVGSFAVQPGLAGAEASGATVLYGSRTWIPGCESPDFAAMRKAEIGRYPVALEASWTSTGDPEPHAGPPLILFDPDEPVGCVGVMGGPITYRSGTATGELVGELPFAYRPPADLGGPARVADVFAAAGGYAFLAGTGSCPV